MCFIEIVLDLVVPIEQRYASGRILFSQHLPINGQVKGMTHQLQMVVGGRWCQTLSKQMSMEGLNLPARNFVQSFVTEYVLDSEGVQVVIPLP